MWMWWYNVAVQTTTSPEVSDTTTPHPIVSPSRVSSQRTGATAGEIGGITIGVIIVILLIALIVVLLIKKHNYPNVFKR